jgi:hypothetical protein
MIARRLALALVALFLTVQVQAGEFDRITAALDRDASLDREWIPFFGFARTLVRVVEPEGVHDIQLAVYNGRASQDWNQLVSTVKAYAGQGYRPMVSAKERSGESTLVLARPKGKLLEMIILNRDGDETVLVRVLTDPAKADSIAFDHDFR